MNEHTVDSITREMRTAGMSSAVIQTIYDCFNAGNWDDLALAIAWAWKNHHPALAASSGD